MFARSGLPFPDTDAYNDAVCRGREAGPQAGNRSRAASDLISREQHLPMEQDTEQLFAAIAVEKGLLSAEQAAECQKARDEARRLGLKVTLAKVAQDRGLLSLQQVREIHREMRKRGTVIRLGRYELLEKVGAGGMGAVWRARDTVLKRTVAIKLLPRHRAGDSRFITRFRREAKLASRIQHPNVVTVYEIGRSGDRHYIAMEFVEGETVADRLKGGEPLSESEALDIARQVCQGLLVAHEQGIIHRDIKPSNIMITPSGLVKVADLGLAKAIEEEGPGLTHSGATLGTPGYMSPEQCRSAKDLDQRTDIYSLGATLFHMLTGRPPYEGETPYEIMRQHEDAAPPDVRDHAPGVSAGASDLVRSMLAKDPDQRPQSCNEIIAEIERIGSLGVEVELDSALPSQDRSAAAREARRSTPGSGLNSHTPTASMLLRPRSRIGLRLAALILIVLLLSIVAVVWLTSRIRHDGTADQPRAEKGRPEEGVVEKRAVEEAEARRRAEEAHRKAEAIAPDSLFRKAADDKVLQVRDNLAEDLKREADQAFDGRQWQRAFSRYETCVKFLDQTTPEIRSRMQECTLGQRESQAVTRAETFVSQQHYAEAATAIRAVRPSGPYGQELKSLQQRIGLGTAQMQARTAYDSGRADEALEILRKVGKTTGVFYDRIRAVKKTWGDAEAAMKKAEFAKAQAASRSILAMEPNEQNHFRREAQKLLASWQDQAATMAMRLVTQGQNSWRERKFSQARKCFEEARRVDPKGQQGIQQIRELKKEALLEFNKALNVKAANSAEAVRIFREVKARLLPDDGYYNEADAWIRKLTGAK